MGVIPCPIFYLEEKLVNLITRQQVAALDEPANTWMWNFTVYGVSGLNILDPIYVLDVDIPLDNIDSEAKFRGGKYYFFPRFSQVSTLNLTFYETHSYYVTSWLDTWRKLVVDENGLFGLPADYMGTAQLVLYDTVGYPRCIITLQGMWPTAPTGLRYNQESRNLEVGHEFRIHSVAITSEYSIASSVLSMLGISNDSILGDVGLGVLGRFG